MERDMENEERETFAISSFRNRNSSHYSLDMKLPIGLLFGGQKWSTVGFKGRFPQNSCFKK
jgi:hypothetical protein